MNAVDDKDMSEFTNKVYEIVQRIPYGRVMTYGQIAALLGVPRAAREVGWALNAVPKGANVPCQRVVNRFGGLASGYGWGGQKAHKADLLPEGVEISDEFTVDLQKYQWFPDEKDLPDLQLSFVKREELDAKLQPSQEHLSPSGRRDRPKKKPDTPTLF
jgi:methylated-DNA-protein-cysteine methyltransferase-like protein